MSPTAGTAQPQETATAKASGHWQDSTRPTHPAGAGGPPGGPGSGGTYLIATRAPHGPVDLGNFFIWILQKLPGRTPTPKETGEQPGDKTHREKGKEAGEVVSFCTRQPPLGAPPLHTHRAGPRPVPRWEGAGTPTCPLCAHHGHIGLPLPGVRRGVGAALLLQGVRLLGIPARPARGQGEGQPPPSAAPSPTAAPPPPPPEVAGPLTSPGSPSAWRGSGGPRAGGHEAGSGVRTARGGARGQGRRRAPDTPPPPARQTRRREPPGPAGKMADGPGWLVTRGAPNSPRIPGPNSGSGGPRRPPKALPAHRHPRGPGCLSLPLDTSPGPPGATLPGHPALTPPGTRRPGRAPPPPHPAGRGRPDPGALARPPSAAARGLTRSGSATGRRHAPRPQAAGGGRAGGRQRGGGGRARGGGGIRACPLHRAGGRAGCSCARRRAGHLKISARGTGPRPALAPSRHPPPRPAGSGPAQRRRPHRPPRRPLAERPDRRGAWPARGGAGGGAKRRGRG